MRRFAFIAAAFLLATAAAPVEQWAESRADISRVEGYLTSLTTIVADFEQVDAAGNLSGGKFYLKRPGKMRWEYKPPTPILLVSNGKVVTYYDSELDQINYVPMDDTLAGFLAQKEITLDSISTKLTKFYAAGGVVRATIIQKHKPTEGSLTLEFTDHPLQLKQMTVTDATGQRTIIQLQNAKFGQELPDSLFKFDDPRGISMRRRK